VSAVTTAAPADIPPNSVVGVTGHRPQSVPSFSFPRLVDLARACLKKLRPRLVIQGGALGWDLATAQASLDLDIPYKTYVPFVGQDSKWSAEDQKLYRRLVYASAEVVLITDGGYSNEAFKARNRAVVEDSEGILALFSGAPSGTAHAVSYAKHLSKPLLNVWTSWVKFNAA
jgi:uncharacterized phage-like protein YoqJ